MSLRLRTMVTACAGAMLLACASSPESPVHPPGEDVASSTRERNRRATELAEKADYAGAIAVWRELTATAPSAPESAYLFRNLGYALFLNGDYGAALDALEKACLLDPLNARGWQHLGSALRKLGQDGRAELMFRQAAALDRHEFSADYALVRGSKVPAIVSAIAAPPRTAGEWATRELDGSSGVVDLRAVAAAPEPVAAQALQPGVSDQALAPESVAVAVTTAPVDMPATATLAPDAKTLRLEVRNGNGVRGMAAATARLLASDTVQVVRLTNEKGFGVERTRIEYEGAHKHAASKLAEQFGAATMVEVDNCWKADMRLVIGKDLIRTRPALVADASARKRAASTAGSAKKSRAAAPPVRG